MIQSLDLSGGSPTTVVANIGNVAGEAGLAVDSERGKLYWSSNGDIYRANLNGSGQEQIVDGSGQIQSIAIDFQSDKLYWSDSLNRIQRASLGGQNVEAITFRSFLPHSITIDSAGGKIYWIETNSIY